MQALLGINLPGDEARVPVFPNQLRVGGEYLHLFVGGLRQRANRAARRMIHRVPEPQLDRVKIVQINDAEFGGAHFRIVHFKSFVNEWISVVMYNHDTLNTYTRRDNDIFFMDEPMNRRRSLLGAYNAASGGRRRTRRNRKISSATKRK